MCRKIDEKKEKVSLSRVINNVVQKKEVTMRGPNFYKT
jgi:hypothetical protein